MTTNINKTYMYNHHSSQIIEHKKTTTFADGNPGASLGQAQNCGSAMCIMWPCNNIISKIHVTPI